jgi:dTDP-glucose 4,6-dehydratase
LERAGGIRNVAPTSGVARPLPAESIQLSAKGASRPSFAPLMASLQGANGHMASFLVTGGAGFIGSNFIPYFLEENPEHHVINIDKLTYAGNLQNLVEVADHPRYRFVHGDICNEELLRHLFCEYDIRGVFHCAAESHVDNSIRDASVFVRTNVMGTFAVANSARNHWMKAPFEFKPGYETCRMHHISTDEVYGELAETGLFSEITPYAPNSPYAASKAGADLIVRSYCHTFGFNATISNCSNNYGPKQHREKLIPTVLRNALEGKPIPIYGDGKNVRDWLYVMDHCSAILAIYRNGRTGETYNVGCWNEQDNNTIVHLLCGMLDRLKPAQTPYSELITYVKDRPGHDRRYAIDAAKLETELGWRAKQSFDKALEETVRWYVDLHEAEHG